MGGGGGRRRVATLTWFDRIKVTYRVVVQADALVPLRHKRARLPAPREGVKGRGHEPLVGEGDGGEGQEAGEPAGGAEGAELFAREVLGGWV